MQETVRQQNNVFLEGGDKAGSNRPNLTNISSSKNLCIHPLIKLSNIIQTFKLLKAMNNCSKTVLFNIRP